MEKGQFLFWMGTVIVPFLWARQMKSAEKSTMHVALKWLPYALFIAFAGWFLLDFILFDSLIITCAISYGGVMASVLTTRLDGWRSSA